MNKIIAFYVEIGKVDYFFWERSFELFVKTNNKLTESWKASGYEVVYIPTQGESTRIEKITIPENVNLVIFYIEESNFSEKIELIEKRNQSVLDKLRESKIELCFSPTQGESTRIEALSL